MSKHLKFLGALLLILMASSKVLSQTSRISGKVADEFGPLPGVNILVKGTSNGTTTDFEGTFSLVNVAEGAHTIVFSYLGYETKEVAITTTANERSDMGTIMLMPSTEELGEVVLKGGYMPSQQKALNIKKNSAAIMEVLANDVIGKLPDRNAAEAVQRMTGVSIERDHGEGRYVIVRGTPIAWNSTLLNGDRMPSTEGTSDNTSGTRAAPLDIFPSEMIEFVQLSKAITPDMEGDAIGGSVNFITKTAPSKRTLNVNLGYGYNDQAQKPIQNGSILYGDRVADGKIGFMLSGTYWNRNWGTDNYEVVYNSDNFALSNLQLRDYLGERTTYGFNAGFEYTPNVNTKIYLRGLKTKFKDRESAVEHIFNFDESTIDLRVREGIIGIDLYGTEIGGNHHLRNEKWKIDWRLSTYGAEMGNEKLPGSSAAGSAAYYMATFSTPVSYSNLTGDGFKFLDIDSPSGYDGDPYDNIQPYLSSPVTADQMTLANQIAFKSHSKEMDYTAQADVTFKPTDKLTLKAGGKFKRMNFERGAPYNYYLYLGDAYGAPIAMTNFDTRPFPERGGYLTEIGSPYDNVLLPSLSLNQLDDLFSAEQLENPLYYNIEFDENNPSSAGSFYSGHEQVAAGYLMGDYKLTDKLSLIGGFRYEHTNLEYDGYMVTAVSEDETTINKISNDNDFGSFLPMVHLKYSPKDNINLRLAYTRTMARANFSELNPTETISLLSTPATISRGNINLKPTYSNNVDLMGEYYFKNVGLLSAGAFYKSLENVIYTGRSYQNIDGTLYQVTQPQNSESGWLAGLEFGLSKRLDFLPGFLSGFGVEANYTFADSEMNVPEYHTDATTGEITETTTTEKIPNQSKHIFNSALFYEKGIFTVRVSGNYKGESLALVQGNPENYRWYDKNFTVDFSGSVNISPKLRMYVELNNLTNEPLRYYQGNTNRPEQTEYYSIRGLFGINYKLF
ncbi:TonB-dependent receptor [Mangrovimonas sp. DI 80]|uniref:TonB-dependent receptor n=1 Tax=Mangrovimonas sp. DI 80 TaxID=1779330 RepID=UPI000976FA2C|nr:TonB-dependent receptor [Mangrovimonas sp. DI 80]OMP32313.1 hypothetical protein BKM32_04485 [Mangrovimonas sp. DI 80]